MNKIIRFDHPDRDADAARRVAEIATIVGRLDAAQCAGFAAYVKGGGPLNVIDWYERERDR